MMQQRRDEILAKKAKLAELKRQRELRLTSATNSRVSIGGPGDVRCNVDIVVSVLVLILCRFCLLRQAKRISTSMLTKY
jgi:hypothetical protein